MYGSKLKTKAAKRRVIVKRVRVVERGRVLGTWKIAYADFVTALMAFFLMLWLISTSPVADLLVISRYFQTPLMVVLNGGQSNVINNSTIPGAGDDLTKQSGQTRAGDRLVITEQDAKKLLHQEEIAHLQQLKHQLETLVEADPKLSKYKNQLLIGCAANFAL